MAIVVVNSVYSPGHRSGTFEVTQTTDGFYVYVGFTHQASMDTDRESLVAMRDAIDSVLKASDVHC